MVVFWDGSLCNFNGYYICNAIGLGVFSYGVLVPSRHKFNVFGLLMGTLCGKRDWVISWKLYVFVNIFMLKEWGSTISSNGARPRLIDCVNLKLF